MSHASPVKLLKDQADKCHEAALGALLQGDFNEAEKHSVEALGHHPGLIYLYKTLGRMFEGLGEKGKAERCFIGELPPCVNDKYFESHVSDKPTFDRKYQKDSFELPISSPKATTPSKLNLFKPTKMTISEVIVDSVDHGSLWFDGFNRFLFDRNNEAISEHSRGNEGLVRKVIKDREPVRVKGRLFFLSNRGFNNFYHWMIDILPALNLFEQAGYKIEPEDKLLVYNATSGFQKTTLQLLGFSPDQVLEVRDSSPYYQAEEIIMPFFANAMATRMGSWIPEFLKSSFLPKQTVENSEGNRYYIARGNQARNGRSIDNESELVAFLEAYNVKAIYPEEYSIQEQATLFSNASLVIATHGAGLTNIVFCKPGTKIIELYGQYMESCYWCISNVCELDYYILDCTDHRYLESQNDVYEIRKNDEKLRREGYSIPLDGLKNTLEIAEIGVECETVL